MDNPVSKNIRALREARSWTQVMLADKAGVSERCVQRAEAGRPISAESLLDLAEALGVTVEELRKDHDAEELERLRRRVAVIPLEELSSPAAFMRIAGGCRAHMFEIAPDPSVEVYKQVVGIQEFIRDYLEIANELTATQRLAAVREFYEANVAPLRAAGWVLSAGSTSVRLTASTGGEPLLWSILLIVAAPVSDARQQAVWDMSGPIRLGF